MKDGRYDIIGAGSLQDICIGRDKIRVPAEVHYVDMYPMDFEEFLWALHGNDETVTGQIRMAYESLSPLGPALHESIMEDFWKYMLVGGMPQAVAAYVDGGDNGFALAEQAKQMIWGDFAEDMGKFSGSVEERDRIAAVLRQITLQLCRRDKRFDISKLPTDASRDDYEWALCWLKDARLIKECCPCTKPHGLIFQDLRDSNVRYCMADTGLLLTMEYFIEHTDDMYLHKEVMEGNYGLYENMLLENAVAQMLMPSRRNLYFYRHYSRATRTTDIETDFMVYQSHSCAKCPIEVRAGSGGSGRLASYKRLKSQYGEDIGRGYVIHTGDLSVSGDVVHLPIYMAMYL